jgi:hypothetical protein
VEGGGQSQQPSAAWRTFMPSCIVFNLKRRSLIMYDISSMLDVLIAHKCTNFIP